MDAAMFDCQETEFALPLVTDEMARALGSAPLPSLSLIVEVQFHKLVYATQLVAVELVERLVEKAFGIGAGEAVGGVAVRLAKAVVPNKGSQPEGGNKRAQYAHDGQHTFPLQLSGN
jgi:uncharacterized protein YoaH (UPF0181 family)